jgi:hypothetical protein
MTSFPIQGITSDNENQQPVITEPKPNSTLDLLRQRQTRLTEEAIYQANLPDYQALQLEETIERVKPLKRFYDPFDVSEQLNQDLLAPQWHVFEEKPIFAVALNDLGPSILSEEEMDIDEITFRGGSTWGKNFDPVAGAPQVTELLSRNAQTNVYMARRALGGLKGELWEDVKKNNAYLAEVFELSEETQKSLMDWATSSPYFYSLKGSTPGSAYFGETVLDILAKDKGPENWNPKEALTQLSITSPNFMFFLENEVGIDKEQLIKDSDTPLKFQYFLADAVDSHAYSLILARYAEKTNMFEETFGTLAWPLLRESLNSNDTAAELAINVGLGVLAATGIGTIPASIILATRLANRTRKIAERGEALVEAYIKAAAYAERARKVSAAVYRNVNKFLPTNIADTVIDRIKTGRSSTVPLNQLPMYNKLGRYVIKQGISEGVQGAIESGVLQYETMENGLQNEFSIKAMGQNVLEEAIGGVVLGGGIKLTQRGINNLVFNKYSSQVGQYIEKQGRKTLEKVPFELPTLLSDSAKRNLNLFATSVVGGTNFDQMTTAQRYRFFKTRLQFNEIHSYLEQRGINAGWNIGDNSNPLLEGVITTLVGTENQQLRDNVKANLLLTLGPIIQKNELNAEDIQTLLLNLPELSRDQMLNLASNNVSIALETTKVVDGVTQTTQQPPKFMSEMDDTEIEQAVRILRSRETQLAYKLGLNDIDELRDILETYNSEDMKLLREILNREGRNIELENAGPLDARAIQDADLEETIDEEIQQPTDEIESLTEEEQIRDFFETAEGRPVSEPPVETAPTQQPTEPVADLVQPEQQAEPQKPTEPITEQVESTELQKAEAFGFKKGNIIIFRYNARSGNPRHIILNVRSLRDGKTYLNIEGIDPLVGMVLTEYNWAMVDKTTQPIVLTPEENDYAFTQIPLNTLFTLIVSQKTTTPDELNNAVAEYIITTAQDPDNISQIDINAINLSQDQIDRLANRGCTRPS